VVSASFTKANTELVLHLQHCRQPGIHPSPAFHQPSRLPVLTKLLIIIIIIVHSSSGEESAGEPKVSEAAARPIDQEPTRSK